MAEYMSDIFSLTKIVIIDSLEETEFQTGYELERFIRTEFEEHGLAVPVERYSVQWPNQFEALVRRLTAEATGHGARPLLHVETHGDPIDGLIFSEGGSLPWGRVSEMLIELNRATRFNLVSFFAACYGAYFAGELWVNRPAPCFALLAPEDEVDPGELYRGFRRLYHELALTHDMGRAAKLLTRQELAKGRWLNRTAASWFPEVLLAVARQHGSEAGLRAMAARVMARREAHDLPSDCDMEQHVKNTALAYLRDIAFNRFFMVEDFPENADRFSAVKERVLREIIPLLGQ